jgi:hypothetical protein
MATVATFAIRLAYRTEGCDVPEVSLFLDHPGFFVHDASGGLERADIPEIGAREPPPAGATDRVVAVGTIAASGRGPERTLAVI